VGVLRPEFQPSSKLSPWVKPSMRPSQLRAVAADSEGGHKGRIYETIPNSALVVHPGSPGQALHA